MTPLPDSLLESVAAAAVREGLADAVFTRLATPARPPAGRPGARRPRARSPSRRSPRTDVLAEVAAALGPRIIGSDRELAAERDALVGLPRGRRDDARPAGRPAADARRRSGTRVLEALRAACRRGETVTYGELAARAGNPQRRRAPSARPARATRSRSSCPATACCPAAAGSATTAAARSASARCSSSRARSTSL